MSESQTVQLADLETAQKLGLLQEEYDKICQVLGRTPNFTELSIFSVMWSEHCSYKNSIIWLKKLPKEGPRVLAAAGEENAGLMDIGGGLGVCFKIESHNHPSAIEPYQGAATGVGGIQRDIFTMGARPIASLNSLRFGKLDEKKTRHLLKGVVKGIGDYGNAFGVPTVGGEVYFDECYHTNPLVNAMSVGIVEEGKTASAISTGVGNPVFIVGSATGKDGIHGATFASGDITEDSINDLPSVQVGDPFQEKLLLEATLEAIDTGFIVGVQDMGAAGISCSTSEMSEKGGHGMRIQLDRVPARQENMKAFELLLSESQERMLMVVEKGNEDAIQKVFEKWDVHCVNIGEVTEGGMLDFYMGDTLEARVPAEALVLGGGAPIYVREQKEPEYLSEINKFNPSSISQPESYKETTHKLLLIPSIASKNWITEQYDSMVGRGNMSSNTPSAAAVVNVIGTPKGLAVTTDCNSRYVRSNPQIGCAMAVCESVRNIICSGGDPLGVTNCLNFGNPYNPEVYWQFTNSILGMKEACEKFGLPVTGGNVSFYNQSSDDGPVFPTPTIGMVGILEDAQNQFMGMGFQNAGDKIYLLGEVTDDISCSEYVYNLLGVKDSPAPHFDLEKEFTLMTSLKEILKSELVQSANDISEGGLIVSLLESAFINNLGIEIKSDSSVRKDAFLFGEGSGRVLLTCKAENATALEQRFTEAKVDFQEVGVVTSGVIKVDGEDWGIVNEFKEGYSTQLGNIMEN